LEKTQVGEAQVEENADRGGTLWRGGWTAMDEMDISWPAARGVEHQINWNLLTGLDQPDWQERALCAQTDPEAFFPEKGGSTREAKRICAGCDVRAECLEYALTFDERFGIWGGLSERERRRLKRGAV
jgi:WhiB family redox-sensing transcriptional regulator